MPATTSGLAGRSPSEAYPCGFRLPGCLPVRVVRRRRSRVRRGLVGDLGLAHARVLGHRVSASSKPTGCRMRTTWMRPGVPVVDLEDLSDAAVLPVGGDRAGVLERQAVVDVRSWAAFRLATSFCSTDDEDDVCRAPGVLRELAAEQELMRSVPSPVIAWTLPTAYSGWPLISFISLATGSRSRARACCCAPTRTGRHCRSPPRCRSPAA